MPYRSRIPDITAKLLPEMNAVVESGAALIEARAKDRVPVVTGRLRDAIHIEKTGLIEYEIVAGDSDAFYGHIVEHGGIHQPAQPFLVPSMEESRAEIVSSAAMVLKNL